ncbi:TPP-dependent indolepyruvate ferredoxin oxidoreductase alpha subunit [Methanofollis sp. W23]|uniref:thiamine pyrophosphate-dependent enzyme n=1 Tax=Methanofollis sp. W23 TaxID=2817849 RepID=UPI001AE3E0E4|nr:thiamine pyrophosphate-dependent enzyme [Methanofollis sp. W23]MBP2146474.1 TPP-dependent indolepyruvate ferredoxin oxidoreductase alpha subunit [Methanofollis sp. W23]
MNGAESLATALRTAADHVYGVPGYPVTEVVAAAGAEVCVNEKVALEYALGDSLSGRRAAVVVKHVGMNLLADPLVQATAQGLCAGVVVLVGDDPLARASQVAEDSRAFGQVAMVPVVEPEDPSALGAAVEEAFLLSESLSRVVILRVVPEVLGADAAATPVPRNPGAGALADPGLTTLGRWQHALQVMAALSGRPAPGGIRVTYPAVPAPEAPPERFSHRGYSRTLCGGCPYRPLFSLLAERGMRPAVDAGCSLLAVNPPYCIGTASYGLGSAVAVGARSTGVALIGDYALLHSGVNALIDIYEKEIPLLCIVLENRRMGMVGGQETPGLRRYLGWAEPEYCQADDLPGLRRLIVPADRPKTVVVSGECPAGECHEKVECRDL